MIEYSANIRMLQTKMVPSWEILLELIYYQNTQFFFNDWGSGERKSVQTIKHMYSCTFFLSSAPQFQLPFFHYWVNLSVRICPGSQQAAQEVVGICVMLSATPGNMVSAIQFHCFQLSWV